MVDAHAGTEMNIVPRSWV